MILLANIEFSLDELETKKIFKLYRYVPSILLEILHTMLLYLPLLLGRLDVTTLAFRHRSDDALPASRQLQASSSIFASASSIDYSLMHIQIVADTTNFIRSVVLHIATTQ